ncbi:cytochrome b N-terminal domain-containing protein [Leptolyngbya sp. FACHB-261]|uniref:cytochrome b N-terminal domain-containing protein n=1 Tax=Leptolyngbya sp. FACHB-261 TaxID=2692806 RepID=UPI00168756C8|nr:cytochrome b N-terminal domain-containing protein [Leptolyngbya sp. FACHB-261]MBD2104144.1 cytochrome bc complex cytochrome b subunit [Leptolyngbya sp. FACHB-261]
MQYTLVLQRLATVLALMILTLMLAAASSGVLMAFNYEPVAGEAFNSLQSLTDQVPYGWLVETVHNLAGNWLIGLALVQMVVMFLSRQFRTSWLSSWVSIILLILVAIGLGWTAMILPWTQDGYWRFNIELSTIQSIPLIGPTLRETLTGGGAIGTATVERMYALHSYVLAVVAVFLSIIHLVGIVRQRSEQQSSADEVGTEVEVSG